MSFLPVGAAAVPLTALVATLHPLNQTWLVLHPSQRWRGRGTHCPPAAQRPGLPDQPKPRLQLPNRPPFHLLQPRLCGRSGSHQEKGVLGLRRDRRNGQGVVAQRGASRSGEDAVDVQGLSPGPPGRPVAASRRTRERGRKMSHRMLHDSRSGKNTVIYPNTSDLTAENSSKGANVSLSEILLKESQITNFRG